MNRDRVGDGTINHHHVDGETVSVGPLLNTITPDRSLKNVIFGQKFVVDNAG